MKIPTLLLLIATALSGCSVPFSSSAVKEEPEFFKFLTPEAKEEFRKPVCVYFLEDDGTIGESFCN